MRKRLNKLASCLMTGILIAATAGTTTVSAKDKSIQLSANEKSPIKAKERVSVHDPSIVKVGNEYYVFGSHIEAAKSSDLQNWTKFTNSYTTPGNALFGDLSKNLAGSFKWAGQNDSDCAGGYAVWAPYVFWNKDYVNTNGKKGAYVMYYCTSSTYKRSCIGYAVSQNIEGPYTYVDTIVYSGFTKGDAYDSKSVIDTKYTNTNIKTLLNNGTLKDINTSWFTSSGDYNTSYAPNAIDPDLFYDSQGKLWMSYGSWSGGIYMLEIDKKTGKAIYPGTDGTAKGGNSIDRYFGTHIAGGYTKSGEGSCIVYDKKAGYYYLTMSYAGLAAQGGYNMRMFRSKNPQGPYLDAAGNKATLTGNIDNSYCGVKLMGNYKFDCLNVGYRSPGGNTSFIDSDGQMYLVYHTRFDNGTEGHEVRVHQMFVNKDGWPVAVPYEYSGDKISKSGYSEDEVVGYYQFINHGTSNSAAMLKTLNIKLNKDHTISGDATGKWNMKKKSPYVSITIGGVTYKGVFFKQQNESAYVSKVMTFSAVGTNNECIWGSKLDLSDSDAVSYAARYLTDFVPSSTKTNLTLPSQGPLDTNIKWSSSNPSVIGNNGVVNRLGSDTQVNLTAAITKGSASITKTFTVTVKAKLDKISEIPIYKYTFENVEGKSTVLNSGAKLGNAALIGTASIVKDTTRGNVLKVTNAKGAIKVNYLSLPTNTFDSITANGYTIGMWVNVDKSDLNYFEHSALFEANAGGQNQYPVTRISANLFSRINSNGSFADATDISTTLTSNTWQYVTYTVNSKGIYVYLNGNQVGNVKNDLTACFTNNFLSKMKDVRVGSGNIWGDPDIASAKFDNVSIYNMALNDEEVEALYNQEALNK